MRNVINFLDAKTLNQANYDTNIMITSSSNTKFNGIIVESGHADLFCPDDVIVDGHYFAMLLSDEYHWEAKQGSKFKQLTTNMGQIWVNPKGNSFSHRVCSYNEFGLVMISDDRIKQIIGDSRDYESINFDPKYNADDVQLKNLISILLAEVENNNANQSLFFESVTNALILHYLNNYSNYKEQQSGLLGNSKIKQLTDFIQSNLTSDLSLAHIAQQFGLSQTTLINSFKHELKQTPHNFILTAKLQRSANLLKTTLLTIAEIAAMLNFSDQSHFNRLFKSYYKITPLQFRQQS